MAGPTKAAPWLEIAIEEERQGIRELTEGNHPRILEYLATCNDVAEHERFDDATPWCSAFVNWCVRQAGLKGTDSSWARSWGGWGVEDDSPGLGTIVVWTRYRCLGEDTELVGGHVAFLIEDRGDSLYVLGGNQRDCICRRAYPRIGFLTDSDGQAGQVREKYELIGFRRPAPAG